jgi:hypothetical protein
MAVVALGRLAPSQFAAQAAWKLVEAMSVGSRTSIHPKLLDAIRAALSGDAVPEISVLLEQHDPRFVGPISDVIRRAADEALYCAEGWHALRSWAVATPIVAKAVARLPALAFVLSTSGIGYVREAAVARVELIPGAFSLALLVVRLNDWVPQVRRAAELKLANFIPSLDHRIAADCIEYLWRFESLGRATHIGREIVRALVEDDRTGASVRDAILIGSGDRSARLVRLSLGTPALDQDLETFACNHRHPKVRAMAAKTALEGVYSWRERTLKKRALHIEIDRLALALRLLSDRSADVQYHALQYVVQNLQDNIALDRILLSYLLHPRPKLSDLAQWKLNKRGVDWLAWLRGELEKQPFNIRIARLLGRVGTSSDGDRLWRSALLTSPRDQLVFVTAAVRLENAEGIEAARRIALDDINLSRARAAAAALLDGGAPIPIPDLERVALRGSDFVERGLRPHVREHGVMDQLKIFCRLEAARSPPDETELSRLVRRINRGGFDPTRTEIEDLHRLSAACPRVRGWLYRLQI